MLHPVFTAPVWQNDVDWAVSCSAGTLHTRTASFPLRTNVLYHPMLVLWDFKFSRRRVWSWESSGMYCRIALMMEVARPSETSVDIQLRPRQYIPEDSELYVRFVSLCTTALLALWSVSRLVHYSISLNLHQSCSERLFRHKCRYSSLKLRVPS
jgi:hypothetical protein